MCSTHVFTLCYLRLKTAHLHASNTFLNVLTASVWLSERLLEVNRRASAVNASIRVKSRESYTDFSGANIETLD